MSDRTCRASLARVEKVPLHAVPLLPAAPRSSSESPEAAEELAEEESLTSDHDEHARLSTCSGRGDRRDFSGLPRVFSTTGGPRPVRYPPFLRNRKMPRFVVHLLCNKICNLRIYFFDVARESSWQKLFRVFICKPFERCQCSHLIKA